jgi:hypothetical protein
VAKKDERKAPKGFFRSWIRKLLSRGRKIEATDANVKKTSVRQHITRLDTIKALPEKPLPSIPKEAEVVENLAVTANREPTLRSLEGGRSSVVTVGSDKSRRLVPTESTLGSAGNFSSALAEVSAKTDGGPDAELRRSEERESDAAHQPSPSRLSVATVDPPGANAVPLEGPPAKGLRRLQYFLDANGVNPKVRDPSGEVRRQYRFQHSVDGIMGARNGTNGNGAGQSFSEARPSIVRPEVPRPGSLKTVGNEVLAGNQDLGDRMLAPPILAPPLSAPHSISRPERPQTDLSPPAANAPHSQEPPVEEPASMQPFLDEDPVWRTVPGALISNRPPRQGRPTLQSFREAVRMRRAEAPSSAQSSMAGVTTLPVTDEFSPAATVVRPIPDPRLLPLKILDSQNRLAGRLAKVAPGVPISANATDARAAVSLPQANGPFLVPLNSQNLQAVGQVKGSAELGDNAEFRGLLAREALSKTSNRDMTAVASSRPESTRLASRNRGEERRDSR